MFRCLKVVVLFFAMVFAHQNATAQSELSTFDYLQKASSYALAKTGDAESLFRLGLSHYYGQNASNDLVVAERFFFFAARNGNSDAKIYLEKLRAAKPTLDNTPKLSADVQPLTAHKRNATPEKIQNDFKKEEPSRVAERISPPKAVKIEKYAEVNPAVLSVVPVNSEVKREAKNRDGLMLNPAPIKTSIQFNAAPVIIDDEASTRFSLWRFVFYILIAIAIMAAIIVLRDLFNQLPPDFNDEEYLALNPDVERSGMDARLHYAQHGKIEGRQYKY